MDAKVTVEDCPCVPNHRHGALEGKRCLCCDMNPLISTAELVAGLRWLAAHYDSPLETNVGSEGRTLDTGAVLIVAAKRILAAESQIADRDAQITEMRIELKCRLETIKQMRRMAFDARAKVATLIFAVEQLANSEENRIAELGLEATDAQLRSSANDETP